MDTEDSTGADKGTGKILPKYMYTIGAERSALLTQYRAGDKIEKNELGGACSTFGEGRGMYRVLVGKPEGKRPLGRTRRRWEDNIMMDLQGVGWCEDWIGLAQDRDNWRALLSAVRNLRVA
jgi:hypothetical protein